MLPTPLRVEADLRRSANTARPCCGAVPRVREAKCSTSDIRSHKARLRPGPCRRWEQNLVVYLQCEESHNRLSLRAARAPERWV